MKKAEDKKQKKARGFFILPRFSAAPWLPYVAPMAGFMALTALEGVLPGRFYIPLYVLKIFVVTALLVACRSTWRDIPPQKSVVAAAVMVGLGTCLLWVGLDKLIPYPHLGTRTAFDPFAAIENPAVRGAFLVVRFYGLVLMVPVMEELFWRSFLLRYATDADFETVPLGTFSPAAFGMVAVVFALAHAEWLVAILAAAAYALLLRHTKSLFACIVAHGITNLALGLYVLVTRDWAYW